MANFVRAQVLWGYFSDKLDRESEELMAMAPPSVGLERVFSSMGHVHSENRNKLNPEKIRKLAFCMRLLNSANNSE